MAILLDRWGNELQRFRVAGGSGAFEFQGVNATRRITYHILYSMGEGTGREYPGEFDHAY